MHAESALARLQETQREILDRRMKARRSCIEVRQPWKETRQIQTSIRWRQIIGDIMKSRVK